MPDEPIDTDAPPARRLLQADELSPRVCYRLMTSLVVPRPIAWVSSRSASGVRNLAPFSYFMGLAGSPPLVGVSIGQRGGRPKDTLANIRDAGAFCINSVTARHLQAMNLSAGTYEPDVDEFEVAGLAVAEAANVAAPYVRDAVAVLECRLFREVDLTPATSTLVIGEVVAFRVPEPLVAEDADYGTGMVPYTPVGRLGGNAYALVRDTLTLERPRVD